MSPVRIIPEQDQVPGVDDSLDKSQAALDSLLQQVKERQDMVANELNKWRSIAKTCGCERPEEFEMYLSEIRSKAKQVDDFHKEFARLDIGKFWETGPNNIVEILKAATKGTP